MHGPDFHQRPLIWLVSGTGEGPPLAAALLQRGWRVQVSVVNAAATRAYASHGALEISSGALRTDADVANWLEQAQPHWVVDASHPFALEISQRLLRVCQQRQQPLLRLQRPLSQGSGVVEHLPNLSDLAQRNLAGERLLLAIGSRSLAQALAVSSAATHFARILDQPHSLQLARAAGFDDQRLACVRPNALGDGRLERALCRHWCITSVLCRQSGGTTERLWRDVCAALELRLLLLERPAEPGDQGLPMPQLLEMLTLPAAAQHSDRWTKP